MKKNSNSDEYCGKEDADICSNHILEFGNSVLIFFLYFGLNYRLFFSVSLII